MARTTVDIDPSVLRELKRRQQREHKTLGQLISELLVQALAATAPERRPLQWSSEPMGARVDLEDDEALMGALGDM